MSKLTPRISLLNASLVIAALAIGGCAGPRIFAPGSTVRVVVLDAATPPGHGTGDPEIVGWWFTARDVHRDPNDGFHWGDLLAEALQQTIPNVHVHSRLDLRTFMATRRDLLRQAYPTLTPEEMDRLLLEQAPVDYGRALGADFVIASNIDDAFLSHHRTFHWWTAVVEIDAQVWNVATGERTGFWVEHEADKLSSTYSLMRKLARQCAHDLGRQAAFISIPAVAPASINEQSQ